MCAARVFLWPSTLPARVLEPGPAQGFALFSYTTVAWSGFRLWVFTSDNLNCISSPLHDLNAVKPLSFSQMLSQK